jgi:hypothetical protein
MIIHLTIQYVKEHKHLRLVPVFFEYAISFSLVFLRLDLDICYNTIRIVYQTNLAGAPGGVL